jgi:hypothetical protein
MKKSRIRSLLLLILLLLLAMQSAQAMDSTQYSLDWFTPLTTNGGGASTSTNYAVNLTIGQTVRGSSTSAQYGVGLGYWSGITNLFRIFLPLILRNSS